MEAKLERLVDGGTIFTAEEEGAALEPTSRRAAILKTLYSVAQKGDISHRAR